MVKYLDLENDVFSIFATQAWKAEKIQTFPNNFVITKNTSEFIRINIIPSGRSINVSSVSGIIIVDIFTLAGSGTRSAILIADKLDQYLKAKTIRTALKNNTQFMGSSLTFNGTDPDNPSLFRSTYTIPFNFYGAL